MYIVMCENIKMKKIETSSPKNKQNPHQPTTLNINA